MVVNSPWAFPRHLHAVADEVVVLGVEPIDTLGVNRTLAQGAVPLVELLYPGDFFTQGACPKFIKLPLPLRVYFVAVPHIILL